MNRNKDIMDNPVDRGELRKWAFAGLGAAGALIVCDLTRVDTLPSILKYANQLRTVSPLAQIVVVANKVDLEQQLIINDEQLHDISQEVGAPYYLTSAKSGINVESAFSRLADLLDGVADEVVAP